VKDLTAGLPARINMHCCVESDQRVPIPLSIPMI
jgi:hypothetical protein